MVSVLFVPLVGSFVFHPLKLAMLLLVLSLALTAAMKMVNGQTWTSFILFMVFTGGVLVMFMILSSFLPNEKSLKTKMNPALVFLFFLFLVHLVTTPPLTESLQVISTVKTQLTSDLNFPFSILILLTYFAIFAAMLSKSPSAMKSSF